MQLLVRMVPNSIKPYFKIVFLATLRTFVLLLRIFQYDIIYCRFEYIYEIKRLYNLNEINKSKILDLILFKNIFGYSIIPKEFYNALEIVNVENAFRERKLKIYSSRNILSSEIIKYAHALDKGLRMPQKREVFGREKSEVLEKLLLSWAEKFEINYPIYLWAKELLIEYWIDQSLYEQRYSEFIKKESISCA